LASYGRIGERLYEAGGFAMGTIISQRIYGPGAKQTAAEVLAKIKYLETLMTINSPGGDINRLNDFAGNRLNSIRRRRSS
jgi:thiamine biosynthesis lipoprotein